MISFGRNSAVKGGLDGYANTIKIFLSILDGEYEPKGKLPFELNLK